ncbi:MAG TPA: hypothetical protein PL110_01470 [Candidatus Eremiobacteraeota bacterium]|nr:MAG: hypothetical protein BWY64_00287 [bacterium ADurb.Bin363]HPZ06757.1 hypothetical protein [Candidatus Eremiobacteraeota bacterium]
MIMIAWDIDDVLNDLMGLWFENQWLKEYPECNLTYADLKENPPYKLLGVKKEDYLKSLDRFRLKRYLHDVVPVPEILEWFLKYGDRFRHMALTSVPLSCAHVSAFWLFKYFGNWIRTFHLVPSKREEDLPLYDYSKGEYLNWLGKVNILIDDNETNIKSADSYGIKGILMPKPWNSQTKTVKEVLDLLIDVE